MRNYCGLFRFGLIILILIFTVDVKADVSESIKAQLASHKIALYYPASVERFYKQAGYKLLWIAPNTVKTHAWDAMLLLDCVIQYGLNHSDYHPKELLYDQLHKLIEQPDKGNIDQQASYDITLTDAIFCFINNLHYGRVNPAWSAAKIDLQGDATFNASAVLLNALAQKDFYSAIIIAQPKSPGYKSLQYQMYIVTGLHTGDCYVTPPGDIRLMAINMERQRWINGNQKESIQINQPSGILSLFLNDTVYKFKIKGSIPLNLPASLNEFTFYKGSVIIKQVNGKLSDEPESLKIFSSSYINILHADKFVKLLLNQKVSGNRHRLLKLGKPLPLVLTYYTCEIQDGVLVTYKDVSGLDKNLEKTIYK